MTENLVQVFGEMRWTMKASAIRIRSFLKHDQSCFISSSAHAHCHTELRACISPDAPSSNTFGLAKITAHPDVRPNLNCLVSNPIHASSNRGRRPGGQATPEQHTFHTAARPRLHHDAYPYRNPATRNKSNVILVARRYARLGV
jgi:hypothetical protein